MSAGAESINPGLSVVMIGRNEATSLRQAIIPALQLADEVVFVDTGSNDSSAALAEALGARVFFFAWCDDFSRAKNFAVEQARHAWILNMDCDESIDVRQARKILQEALSREDEQAYQIRIDNVRDNGDCLPSSALRLFRNDKRIRFANPIHESVGESLYRHWPDRRPPELPLRLMHWGYSETSTAEKTDRNWRVLQQWLEREPENIFANFKAGQTLRGKGEIAEAATRFGRAFHQLLQDPQRGTYPYWPDLVQQYLECLMATGSGAEAAKVQSLVAVL